MSFIVELHLWLIEITALAIVIVICFIGFFRTKYWQMMPVFLAIGFIAAVLLKSVMP